MVKIELLISGLALFLGAINFYWTFLRNRKALYVVYVQKIDRGLLPEFAVVNGGKQDILITKLECCFVNEQEKSTFTPAQRVEFKESESFLITYGKGIHCKVDFVEKFTTSFVKKGVLEKIDRGEFYIYDMLLDIEWVEMCGKSHAVSVKLIRYGFRETGEIASRKILIKKIDLYKQKP